VITLVGAIATFLFGMSIMTDGLEKLSSGRLESILERLTSNVYKGVLLGALVTGLIQSSSATTVMCVGFVNAGILKLEQAVGIIMGANIGTTITAQLLRLGDISAKSNLLLQLLKPSALGPLLATVGIVFYMFLKGGRKRIVGQLVLGFGLLFIGMNTMETAVSGLQDLPEFRQLFVTFTNPIIGILVGALVTALIQSSSASVGILQAISSTGVVTFNGAMPLIFGQNIGTCVTALLSSVGASRNAKRTALIHLLFNIIGTLVFLIILYAGHALFHFSFWTMNMDRGSIANLHLFFNILSTLLLLPFHKLLVRIVQRLVPSDAETPAFNVLDERFLSSPSVALEQSRNAVISMGRSARDNFYLAVELLHHFDEKKLEQLQETESTLDKMENMLDNYLVKLTDRALTDMESMRVSELLHTLSDFERIGDYAVNIADCAVYLHSRGLMFSSSAMAELRQLNLAVGDAISITLAAYRACNRAMAMEVEPLEEVVDLMRDVLRSRHIERLKNSQCTIELGSQFFELLINLERISDHCSNVAMLVIRQTAAAGEEISDSHAYLKYLHSGGSEEFDRQFAEYREKYFSPIADESSPFNP
jgi:phosphate:Na+ symporter